MSFESALGSLLRPVRAGESRLAWKDARLAAPRAFALTSPAFEDGGMMRVRSAASGVGDNLSPPLDWTGVPGDAAELALIVQDPDAPLPWPVTHLIAFGIDPSAGGVEEGALGAGRTDAIQLGRGSFRRIGYQGPRPVAGHGPHRYVFQMFALVRLIHFDSPPDLATVVAAMARAVLARGQLTGRYERP
jgi:Raf kinase inhibitor-like YbhB/YbcL family protein